MQVDVLGSGGAPIASNDTISIAAGSAVTFRITNALTWSCGTVRVQDISISNTTDFSLTPTNPTNVKPAACNGTTHLDFTVTALGTDCVTYSTVVSIRTNLRIFTFTFEVVKSPIISVLGGSPLADVMDGDITTTATNGTYFGVVEGSLTKTRDFIIVNTGTCTLDISGITSTATSIDASTGLPYTNSSFSVTPYVLKPIYPPAYPYYSPAGFPASIEPGYFAVLKVTFAAGDPANNEAIISITNNTAADTDLFTFTVNAEVFDVTGPGPGGVTADFRLWLKATRGIRATAASKVYLWKDLGSNGKDAKQDTVPNQPTYKDDATSNINFNPVIEFENNGATDGTKIEQYLYNEINGFYSQDIFIVMMPETPLPSTPITPFSSTSSRNTIFSGVNKKAFAENTFDANDITGVGFGNYTATRFTDELLTYSQNTETSLNGIAEISTTKNYTNAGIINVRNDAEPVVAQELLYNSMPIGTVPINDVTYTNVGYLNEGFIWGTPY
jgi:hypothetical protein